MKRRNIKWLLGAAILALALAGAAYYWRQAKEIETIATASIPAQPTNLKSKPAELQQRIKMCEQHIRSGADVRAALAELSQLYHVNGFLAEASQCYQGLLRIEPSNPRWPHRFASILAGFGQLDDAIALWRRTVALANDYTAAQLRLADALLKCNQTAEATKIYSKVLEREPENPHALVGMALIDVNADRLTTARSRLEAAVAQTDYNIGYDLLVTVCEQQGDTNRAESIRAQHKASGAYFDIPDLWLKEMYSDCYDSYLLSLFAGTVMLQGDLSTAIGFVERAITFDTKNGYYYIQAAALYQRANNLPKAIQHMQTATIVAPDLPDVWQNLFSYLLIAGRADEAASVLVNGLAHCPNSPGLHFERGKHLAAVGRLEEAISDLKQAAAILNDDAKPSLELANIYFQLNRIPEGFTALQNALTAEPDNPPALSTLTFYNIMSGDETGARKSMQRVKDQPRIPPKDRLALEQAFQQKFGHAPY